MMLSAEYMRLDFFLFAGISSVSLETLLKFIAQLQKNVYTYCKDTEIW